MKKIAIFIIILFPLVSFSQDDSSISYGFESNSQYYLDDSKTGDFLESNRFRSNSFFKIDYSYKNFYVGLQAESYEPKALLNYSPNLDKTNLEDKCDRCDGDKLKENYQYLNKDF
jgi:hypothetical protein